MASKKKTDWKEVLKLEEVSPELQAALDEMSGLEQKYGYDLGAAGFKGKADNTDKLSIKQLKERIEMAQVEQSLSRLLQTARSQSQQSLADVAEGMGVVRSRVAALERSENLEITTLVRYLDTLGYDVLLTLIPKNRDGSTLGLVLNR